MAENLGEAQLRLTVDIRAFEESLRQARQLIQQQLGDVTGRPGQTRTAARTASNEVDRERRQQEAADRRRRRADAEEQRRIDRAARQGGAREGVRALEIAQERRFRLARRIDTLEEQGANVARLRVQLGALTEAQSRRQFGSFRQRGQELARQITLEERRLATLRRQERVQRQNAAVGAAMGGARESIFALERAQDRRFKISQRIERLEERGVATQSLRRQLGELTTSYAQRQFGTARQLSRELERQVTLTEARARRERDVQRAVERTARLGGPREPIQGRLDLPGSPRFLAEQRRREERQLRASATAGGPRDSIRGSRNIPGSPAFLEAQERLRRQILDRGARQGGASESLLANERAQQRRFALDQRIARLQQQGANVGALQIRLAQLDTALSERQFGSARQITAQLGQQVTLTEARLRRTRELQRLTDRAAKVGGPSEPIRGRKDLPGSPAFLEEQRRQEARRARQGGPASSLATRASLQSAQLSIGTAGLQLQRQGADVTQIKKLYADLDSALRTGELGTAKQITQQLRDQLTVAREKLAATQAQAKAQRDLERRGGPSLPVSGRLINGRVIPGSPADIARQATQSQVRGPALPVSGRLINGQVIPGSPADLARQRRLQGAQRRDNALSDAIGSSIIGGAFPLLFGQGLGASVGGGLGGLAGGALGGQFGFGLSLVGTALGAAFDAASERAKTLAKALDSPISQFQALVDASLLSSKALEKQVASLISVGREAEAGALIQRDLISSYGSLDAAQENIKVTDELNRAWSRLTTGMIGFANGPLKLLAQRLENDFQRNRNVGIEKALRDAGLGNRADALRRDSTNPILASDTAQIAAINDRYASELPAVKAATAALESARRTRQQILDLQLRQTAASVRDNTVLQAGVELDLIRLREREKLQQLRADGKLFTETSPGVYELSPEAKRAQEEAASQRRQLAENAAASAERSARELRNARQLIGLEGERLTIKQEQQKVDEAQRLFAEADRTFRQKYSGADPAKLVGAEKEAYDTLFNSRLAAENNLTRVRLQSYEQIQRAEERIALSRQAVEDRIRNAQKGRGLSGLGRGALDDISAFRQQAAAVNLLSQRSQGDPNNTALAEQAKDARRNLTAAGEDLRNKMFDAFRTAQDAVRNISRSFENAQLSLAELQNTRGQGVNKYLNPQQVTQRQELLNPILQARATDAINKFQNRTGIQVPTQVVTGTLEQRNAQFIDIARQFNNETQALEDLTTAQIDLATATRDLNTVIGGLRDIGAPLTDAINANSTAVNALALKNWEVNVNVQAPPAFIPSPG